MPGGRPPVFSSTEEAEKKISEYWDYIQGEFTEKEVEVKTKKGTKTKKIKEWSRHPEHPTITGLALFLGFESRQSFYDYESKGEFTYAIKRARLAIEKRYEQVLFSTTPTGAIFALKNFGWRDKQEIETDGKVEVTVKYEKRDSPT